MFVFHLSETASVHVLAFYSFQFTDFVKPNRVWLRFRSIVWVEDVESSVFTRARDSEAFKTLAHKLKFKNKLGG